MRGSSRPYRRSPPAPPESCAYVPRITAVAFVHEPTLAPQAGSPSSRRPVVPAAAAGPRHRPAAPW
eukprot:2110535-Prymnesium_polylepis.1